VCSSDFWAQRNERLVHLHHTFVKDESPSWLGHDGSFDKASILRRNASGCRTAPGRASMRPAAGSRGALGSPRFPRTPCGRRLSHPVRECASIRVVALADVIFSGER
jgi:hypothetical protein